MPRSASAALVAALLVATGAVFALTERLKLTPSPIVGTRVTKTFSPGCHCTTASAGVAFRLRRADTLDVDIVLDDEVVRQLVEAKAFPIGGVDLVWDGRRADGKIAAEGAYRARVRLHGERRTIVLPNPIRLDVTPPGFETITADPGTFSPDGDHRGDTTTISYRLTESARVSLYADGVRRVVKRGQRPEASVQWDGHVKGRPVRRGIHRIVLEAVDAAGNVARSRPIVVVVRSVSLGRDRISAVAGRSFAVRVSSDATSVRWRLGGRTGLAHPGTLLLRAPLAPGTYTLFVTVNHRSARATVEVR